MELKFTCSSQSGPSHEQYRYVMFCDGKNPVGIQQVTKEKKIFVVLHVVCVGMNVHSCNELCIITNCVGFRIVRSLRRVLVSGVIELPVVSRIVSSLAWITSAK